MGQATSLWLGSHTCRLQGAACCVVRKRASMPHLHVDIMHLDNLVWIQRRVYRALQWHCFGGRAESDMSSACIASAFFGTASAKECDSVLLLLLLFSHETFPQPAGCISSWHAFCYQFRGFKLIDASFRLLVFVNPLMCRCWTSWV